VARSIAASQLEGRVPVSADSCTAAGRKRETSVFRFMIIVGDRRSPSRVLLPERA
jgi:hypothetical protein